jgi:hypothetical protein
MERQPRIIPKNYKIKCMMEVVFALNNLLSIGVWSVGGSPDMTVMRKTVMLSIVEMPSVIFSPDSAGIRKTNLEHAS